MFGNMRVNKISFESLLYIRIAPDTTYLSVNPELRILDIHSDIQTDIRISKYPKVPALLQTIFCLIHLRNLDTSVNTEYRLGSHIS